MGILRWYWYDILGIPLRTAENWFNFQATSPWVVNGLKTLFTIALLVVVYEVFLRTRTLVRRYRDRKEMQPVADPEAPYIKDSDFTQKLDAMHAPEQTIAALKKKKDYGRMAEVYASLNQHRQAARWHRKAKQPRRAAMELAKAGLTVKAANLLAKDGDYTTAARFYLEKNKYAYAAWAFEKIPDHGQAGRYYAKAGKYKKAAPAFEQYFANQNDAPDARVEISAACLEMLKQPRVKKKLPEAQRKKLLAAIAASFEQAQRHDLAVSLHEELGDPYRAAQAYMRLGKLEQAAKAMQAAGKPREAAELGARYYESMGRFKEAGAAYEGAGDFRKAGDCHARSNDAQRAAQCYAKAGEHFGAGLALVHAQQWNDAIPHLQSVEETHPRFSESRALLGRCFYEMKDYAHSAAALENHLTGDRVRSNNIDYWWMLALAYEQLGELDKSRSVLQKIRSVDMDFRDVSQRLSNIESRISMGGGMDPVDHPTMLAPEDAAVKTLVENSVGSRYKLERELGRGGMGVVYLAQDVQLDRPVALKFLGSLVDGSEEFRERFVREARAAAKVAHPNIISIYDISVNEGKSYIAMEYVEGEDLFRYMQRQGKLPARMALNIIGQACAALSAIHEAGIVHRDIKPENILVAKGGLVKLMDFGLAKGLDKRITGTNVVMGTPVYMAPEQAQGSSDVDARADIYSMGLVLYEALTGRTAFKGENVLQRQINELPPPPKEFVEEIPGIVNDLVMKCIAKDPNDRFQSSRDLLNAIREADNKSRV